MLFLDVLIHVAGCYSTEEVNILVRMELGHLALRSRFCTLASQRF